MQVFQQKDNKKKLKNEGDKIIIMWVCECVGMCENVGVEVGVIFVFGPCFCVCVCVFFVFVFFPKTKNRKKSKFQEV